MTWWHVVVGVGTIVSASLVLGVRLSLGCDDRLMRLLFRLMKHDHGPDRRDGSVRQHSRWFAVACYWLSVPVVVVFVAFVVLPVFAAGAATGWATGWRYGR